MANLVQSWDGWDYYSDGTVIGPDNSYYFQGEKVWTPSPVQSSGGSWSDGWGSTLQGLAGTVVNTWSAQTLMQQNQQGQRYREGMPGLWPANGYQQSGSGNMLLLLAAGLAVWALAK